MDKECSVEEEGSGRKQEVPNGFSQEVMTDRTGS